MANGGPVLRDQGGVVDENSVLDVADDEGVNGSGVEEVVPTPQNMMEALEEAGIRYSNEPLEDDGGNRIEVECHCRVKSTADVARITKIAKENKYGVMPIGSKTSATGSFKSAATRGLKGWVGVVLDGSGKLEELGKVEIDGNVYDVIPVMDGQGRILKSQKPGVKHRIQVWGGLIPDDVVSKTNMNKELVRVLGKGHSVYLDLTTRDQACIAGIVATGGQGPVRKSAAFNLHGLVVIDKNGDVRRLEGKEAKKHVGRSGLAGAITEVDMEVVNEEPTEFGFFIPFRGSLEQVLTRTFPAFMAAVGKFTESEGSDPEAIGGPTLRGKHDKNLRIKGFEIITTEGLLDAHNKMPEGAAKGQIGGMHEFMRDSGCEAGFMINGCSGMTRDELEMYFAPLCVAMDGEEDGEHVRDGSFVDALQKFMKPDAEVASEVGEDDAEDYNTGPVPLNEEGKTAWELKVFEGKDMRVFRESREGIAVAARASKKEGPTKSTDLNVKVDTSDPAKIEEAYKKIWAIYYSYIRDFRARGAKIYIYGHNFPGDGDPESGGADAHIRVTFPLKSRNHQSRAPENMAFLEGRLGRMYKELLSLDGQDGITVVAGEKGIVSSPEYARHLEENDPERAAEIFDHIEEFGGATFGARNKMYQLHARPNRMPEGILNHFAVDPSVDENAPWLQKFAKSITLWCENSHRSPEGVNVFTEVLGLLRDYFKLDFNDRIFYSESPEKALHIALASLTDYKHGGKTADLRNSGSVDLEGVSTVVLSDPKDLDDPKFADMKKVLCMDSAEVLSPEDRKKADIIVYSAESFGTGGEMGIIVTSKDAVKYAREIRKNGNNVGYVHSIVDLNEMPHSTIETPKMQVIAELGVLVAEMGGQVRNVHPKFNAAHLAKQEKFTTLNPGPSQIHPDIIENAAVINEEAKALKAATPEERIARMDLVKAKLREYLGVPDDYEIFFGGSATQAMEQITESLGFNDSIVLGMGPFGDRQKSVVSKFSKRGSKVHSVQMRWGTGPNSRMESTVEEIKGHQPDELGMSSCGFFMTGHETGTGVQADVSALSKRLDPRILKIVDGTSEAGSVKRDFKDMDVYFGSFQKFFGVPSGIGFTIVSPRAMARARVYDEERRQKMVPKKKNGGKKVGFPEAPRYRTFVQMAEEAKVGKFHNVRGVLQMEKAVEEYLIRGGIDVIAAETREKIKILSDILLIDDLRGKQVSTLRKGLKTFLDGDGANAVSFVERELIGVLSRSLADAKTAKSGGSRHLSHAVHDEKDRSGVLLHVTPVDRDQGDIRNKVEGIVELGGGYGPYTKETLRLYVSPNITVDRIREIATQIAAIIHEKVMPISKPEEKPFLTRRAA